MTSALLLIVRGPDSGLRFELQPGRLRLGSDSSSDIVLAGLAPHHCLITGDSAHYHLTATSPGATCAINGVPATQATLNDGDRLRLGEIDLPVPQSSHCPHARPKPHRRLQPVLSLPRHARYRSRQPGSPSNPRSAKSPPTNSAPAPSTSSSAAIPPNGPPPLQRHRDTAAEALQNILDQGTAVSGNTLIHAFPFGPNQSACLLWHCEHPTLSAPTFAALAAIASGALQTAAEIVNLEIRTTLAEDQLPSKTGILGASPATQTLLKQIDKVAPRETTVLIQGESGTGKELVARAIHKLSPRAQRPFVALNCAAIADTLLESELFGHEKGAFTGATEQRQGKLELAAGGTVFLDEIGEMALPLQAKMLRVLQQRECERVGGRKTIPLDIRIVAATNRDLASEVKQGAFREDLYHRLNVVSLRTPPLRERGDDILLLAHAFLQRNAAAAGRTVEGFTPDAAAALLRYDWPGNIRELENTIERAVVLGDLPQVQLEDLPDSILDSSIMAPGSGPAFHRSIHDAKRQAIIDAWRISSGDYKAAATHLGVHPNSLLRMIRTLGLRAELGA